MNDTLNSPGVAKPLTKSEIFGYWLSFVLVAALLGATFQAAFGLTDRVTLPLGFAAAFPLITYPYHRRLRRPVGKALVIQTALFWTCCAVGTLLVHALGWV